MNGSAQKLIKYLNGASKRFIIPVYQRTYNWSTGNCRQLFDDLIKIVEQKRKSHFFGSIVSVQNENGLMEEYLIIDGQQRLTTVSLLLLAMYHLMECGEVVSQDPLLKDKILKNFLIDEYEEEEKRIKLKSVNDDKETFDALFKQDTAYAPASGLTINYQFFYSCIQKMTLSIDQLFDAICKLEIVNISLNHEDNPQLIFESLNSTGLALSEGDKIRNYILMGLPNTQQNSFYNNYWIKIESYTAESSTNDVSAFIRDYLSAKQRTTPNIGKVYAIFKKYVEENSTSDTETLLKDLLAYAKRYSYLLRGDYPDNRISACIYRLNRLSTTVIRPFFLEVFRLREENVISNDELFEIFRYTESYLFRRVICDLPTNSLNKIFLLLHQEVVRMDGSCTDYVEKFKYVLLSKKERARFPTDEEFVRCMSERNIYAMNTKNKLYLFERLENHGTNETKDMWTHLDCGEYTIEHIMPQHLSAQWESDLGTDCTDIHTEWLHRLANLTLTAYNSKYSNRRFAEKRDMTAGFKDSGLRLNQWIGQQKQWGLAELQERNSRLCSRVLCIWAYPISAYCPPGKQFDSVSLEEDVILTGRAISKYSFRGAEYSVATWTDMYSQVLSSLHVENEKVLTQLAVGSDSDLSAHFSTNAESFLACREIGVNLYVNTNTDTVTKVNILRKVFELFNIPENELFFYLKDEEKTDVADTTRKKYWEYAIPMIKEALDSCGYDSAKKPTAHNYVSISLGFAAARIDCMANQEGARVELYISSPIKENNKALFDALYAEREAIDKAAGKPLCWKRMSEYKASKVYLTVSGLSVQNEKDWEAMAAFHADAVRCIYLAFQKPLERYHSVTA